MEYCRQISSCCTYRHIINLLLYEEKDSNTYPIEWRQSQRSNSLITVWIPFSCTECCYRHFQYIVYKIVNLLRYLCLPNIKLWIYSWYSSILCKRKIWKNFISNHFGDKTAWVLRPSDIYDSISLCKYYFTVTLSTSQKNHR